ncbi:MAG: hypothetical protein J1E43_11290 [Christensenellaceae bacterium]|nr:hypothetical protein [Christensenellaceae bacterium]
MGVTVSSLHIYSGEPVDPALGRFASFSPGWQTMLPSDIRPEDDLYGAARKLSKKAAAPVLVFRMFDSDELLFALFESGRTAAFFSTFDYEAKKGIFRIPGLVGYPEGHKRRTAEILSCGDVELLAALLEEFFGVALMVFADDAPDTLRRARGDELYRAFHEQERSIRGKRAPIGALLVDEFPGKLFSSTFSEVDRSISNGFLFGMDTPASSLKDLRPVRFSQGKLLPLPEEEIVYATHTAADPLASASCDLNAVRFLPDAPEPFGGKTFPLPPGFYFFDFFGDRRLMLTNFHGGVAFMDADGKLIARFSVKGIPVALEDGYLLTAGSGSFWMYGYEPNNRLRIYRIEEQ